VAGAPSLRGGKMSNRPRLSVVVVVVVVVMMIMINDKTIPKYKLNIIIRVNENGTWQF
jgi:hypothetical protein